MARSDWAALITDPAAEYTAHTELQRFGLAPYLPQQRKRHHSRTGQYVMRCYPLFPRYIFIPYKDAHHPSIRLARGICQHKPVLTGVDGNPWRAPENVINGVMTAERRGEYDDIINRGDSVRMSSGVLACVRASLENTVGDVAELLLPLFGGVKASVSQAKIVRA